MLTRLHQLPSEFLSIGANQLHEILPGPSLIHLPGKNINPVFVSVLLHGNEDVGLRAVQKVLSQFQDKELPRALSIFIGNVEAAKYGMRRLEGQVDYNRVWPADVPLNELTPEHKMMQQIVDEMRERKPFASIDFHNNTGLNPHYACVNKLDNDFLHMATLFGRVVVYFVKPDGVQSMAFSKICPAVTLECGRAGDASGFEHAAEFLLACLHLQEFPSHPLPDRDIDLFHTVATVKVPEQFSFSFDANIDADIHFMPDLDHMNFREMQAGQLLATTREDLEVHLEVVDEAGREVEQRFFDLSENQIRFAASMMPSMLTLDENVIRQDCLCYLMERYPLHLHR